MRARIALAASLSLLVPACLSSPKVPLSRLAGWHVAESGNTRLISDLAATDLQDLAGDLVRFDAIFAKRAGWPVAPLPIPLTIFIFRNNEIGALFGLRGAIGGWANPALDASFITVDASAGQTISRFTLLHEYTHVLLRRNRRAPLPRWFDEGLATYFSTVGERDGVVVLGAAPGTFAERLTRRGALPLDQLFETATFSSRRDSVGDFYATAWAFSHYLMSTPSGRRELAAFVKQVARGVPSNEAQASVFGRSLKQLDAELERHVALLASGVPVETLVAASSFAAPEPPPVVALDPREVAFALGSLALAMTELGVADQPAYWADLARNFLTLALPDGAQAAPRVEAALGEARAQGGDFDAALTWVQSARARAPDDPQVALHAARVSLLRAEAQAPPDDAPALAEAEAQHLRALALAPESASAWFGLGLTRVRLSRSDDALAAFETARRFGWSSPLDLALARLLLERGERERGVALLRPIALDTHESPTQKAAAELLEQLGADRDEQAGTNASPD